MVGPEALAMWSDLRPSYFPGCACGISCASQHRFRIWSGPLWPGSGISRTCLTAWLPPFSFGVSSSGLPGVQDVAAGGVRRPVGWGIHLFRCPVVAGVGRYVWRVADRRRSGGFVQVGWGSDYFLTAWPRHGGFWRKSKVWRGASRTWSDRLWRAGGSRGTSPWPWPSSAYPCRFYGLSLSWPPG